MISFSVHDAYAASVIEDIPAETLFTDGSAPTDGMVAISDATEMPISVAELPSMCDLLTA